jgi:hypothetical protein
MDSRARDLIDQGNRLFAKRESLMSLWQEVADNFYPQRADFTTTRTIGTDFAADLNSSVPLLVQRELGSSIGSMTRRKDTEWFALSVNRKDRLDDAGRKWLEWATGVQRSAMYDKDAVFTRATTEGDNDWAAFGQCVISQEINWQKTALLYRCWHLRDVAWCDDGNGIVGDRHHKVRPTAKWLAEQFGEKNLHKRVQDCLQGRGKDPYTEINCRRVLIPAGGYDDISKGRKLPWVSVYIDEDNQHVINERPSWTPVYIIPRWQTVSGSQYAFSPAVIAGLPDARLIQAMTLTLLEAGEMSVRPPMQAVSDAIQGGIQLWAGGITAIDANYDERMGPALKPVYERDGNLPFGMEMLIRKEETIARAFYLNKLRSIPQKPDMTAYEVSQHLRDWIREASPLFAPLEDDYNATLCEQTFTDLMRANAFGPWQDIPQSIRSLDTEWAFDSPLSQAIEREKGQKFLEAKGLIMEATEIDSSCVSMLNARKSLRDALSGIRVPADWLNSERQVEAAARERMEQQQQAQQAALAQQQAKTAVDAGKAAESFAAVA